MDDATSGDAAEASPSPPNLVESVAVRFRWQTNGYITRDSAGKLVFPRAGAEPGVYRLELGHPHDAVYFGEASELDRRFARYRNPGPQQPTNLRLNDILVNALDSGGSCLLAIAEILGFNTRSGAAPLDLRLKAARVLVESSAIVLARTDGMRRILNLDPAFDRALGGHLYTAPRQRQHSVQPHSPSVTQASTKAR